MTKRTASLLCQQLVRRISRRPSCIQLVSLRCGSFIAISRQKGGFLQASVYLSRKSPKKANKLLQFAENNGLRVDPNITNVEDATGTTLSVFSCFSQAGLADGVSRIVKLIGMIAEKQIPTISDAEILSKFAVTLSDGDNPDVLLRVPQR